MNKEVCGAIVVKKLWKHKGAKGTRQLVKKYIF